MTAAVQGIRTDASEIGPALTRRDTHADSLAGLVGVVENGPVAQVGFSSWKMTRRRRSSPKILSKRRATRSLS